MNMHVMITPPAPPVNAVVAHFDAMLAAYRAFCRQADEHNNAVVDLEHGPECDAMRFRAGDIKLGIPGAPARANITDPQFLLYGTDDITAMRAAMTHKPTGARRARILEILAAAAEHQARCATHEAVEGAAEAAAADLKKKIDEFARVHARTPALTLADIEFKVRLVLWTQGIREFDPMSIQNHVEEVTKLALYHDIMAMQGKPLPADPDKQVAA